MSITVLCPCGKTAAVPDHYAGRTGRCNACGEPVKVPAASPVPVLSPEPAAPAAIVPPSPPGLSPPIVEKPGPLRGAGAEKGARPVDVSFDRDVFLLRQKHFAINEKYAVWDEQGRALLFVERPAHLWRNLLAIFAGVAAAVVVLAITMSTAPFLPESIRFAYGATGFLGSIAAIFAVYITLEQKRHVEFYRGEDRGEKLLRVIQDAKIQLLNATYTVTDSSGRTVDTFSKNYLWDIVSKRWECRCPGGNLLFRATEDSIVKAILRRFLGPLFGLLRLDFVFSDPVTGAEFGRFNRSFTLLDRYVLDMSGDRGRRIDRRLALAMGVMLDTGEKR